MMQILHVQFTTFVKIVEDTIPFNYFFACSASFLAFSASLRSFFGIIFSGLNFRGAGGSIANFPSNHPTRSLGCAPTLNQYLSRSVLRRISLAPAELAMGLYVPNTSRNRPSRGALLWAATMR